MVRRRDGFTLMEAIVSVFLVALSITSITYTILLTSKENQRNYAKTQFLAVMDEIDTYLSKYHSAWDREYFGESYIHSVEDKKIVYYDSDFIKQEDEEMFSYHLDYQNVLIEEHSHLFVSVYDSKDKVILGDIDYGYKRIAS